MHAFNFTPFVHAFWGSLVVLLICLVLLWQLRTDGTGGAHPYTVMGLFLVTAISAIATLGLGGLLWVL